MTLGFVGLGVMGGRMAKRLLDAGHRVIGYNRTRAKARWLADAGLRLADSPREVAAQADVVFTMVTDSPALDAVCRGPDGILAGLRRDAVHVEMSTVSPEAVRTLADEAATRGAHLLDAPVSGSPATLGSGTPVVRPRSSASLRSFCIIPTSNHASAGMPSTNGPRYFTMGEARTLLSSASTARSRAIPAFSASSTASAKATI